MNRTEMKHEAQDALMHGIGAVIGYSIESNPPEGYEDWTTAEKDSYREILRREADRVARLFGFERAWTI